jgi:hypothetical protein
MEARLIEWIGLFLPRARFEGETEVVWKVDGALSSISELAQSP